MTCTQSVLVEMRSEDGVILGDLFIAAECKKNFLASGFETRDFVDPRILSLNGVPTTADVGSPLPMLIYSRPGGVDGSSLMLLEETQYQVEFRPRELSGDREGIKLFGYLAREKGRKSIQMTPLLVGAQQSRSLSCLINFKSYVGKAFFDVEIDGSPSVLYPFEVRSKKLHYIEQYRTMMGEISEACSSLILDKSAPLFHDFDFASDRSNTLYEDFMFLEWVFSPLNLPKAYDHLRKNLHKRLRVERESKPTSLASSVGCDDLINMVNSPETYEPSLDVPSFWPTEMGGYFPSRIQQNVLVEDVDTPENRLVKDFLVSVSNLIDSVNSNLDPERGGYVWDRLQEFLSIIEHYLSDAWLLDVGQLSYVPANSQLLQKKDGYRDIFLMYVSMQLAFRIEWDEISNCMEGHNKKLSSMYELWCYLKLVECLDRISESRTAISDLFGIGGKKWSLTLKREEESIREYRLKIRDRRIVVDLMYQRRFEKGASLASYSIPFNPDYSLIVRLDEERPREYIVVHFDAKYSARIDEAQSEDASESDEERVGNRSIRSPWEEDLCKMHTYKDAILRTEGAYILYPGDESKPVIYRVDEDPPCELSPMPSIGAFSMTPGESKSEEMRLEKFIRSVIANCASKLRG